LLKGEIDMKKDGQSRRDVLKKMIYVAPIILTLPAARAQDQVASGDRPGVPNPE